MTGCDDDDPSKNDDGDDGKPIFFVFPMYFKSGLFGGLSIWFKSKINLGTFTEFSNDIGASLLSDDV